MSPVPCQGFLFHKEITVSTRPCLKKLKGKVGAEEMAWRLGAHTVGLKRIDSIDSYVIVLGLHLVEQFGKDEEVWPRGGDVSLGVGFGISFQVAESPPAAQS